MTLHPNFSNPCSQQTITFLQQNPSLSKSLLAACDHNFDKVTTLIEPLLQAPKRARIASHYIQAIVSVSGNSPQEARTTFLATNLSQNQSIQVTAIASSWLIGRNTICAIFIPNSSVSRRHAVIGYCFGSGFYITDIGSTNGSRVNHNKLIPLERCLLRDGDLIQLGSIKLEFFVSGCHEASTVCNDITCY